MLEANKTIVRHLVETIQNRHDLAQMETFFAPDFVNHLEVRDPASA